ncbi:MAG: GYF domain-containing protein [Chthoniobacterales bacterium]
MTIYIARDGEEIGECERQDLEQLTREGQVLPSDYYWHEGMEDWRTVGDLLATSAEKTDAPRASRVLKPLRPQEAPPAREPARTAEQTVRIPTEATAPAKPAIQYRDPKEFLRQRRKAPREVKRFELPRARLRLIAITIAGLLFIAIGLYLFFIIRSERAGRASALFPLNAPSAQPNADEILEKASATLREKIERLPARPEPPLYRFFYDVRVEMKKSLSTRIPWWALIRGGENVVDPETQKTTVRTDFILTIEYRDGEWTFKHYRASVSDMVKEETSEIEEDEKTTVPPSIVGMLGVKMPH